MGHRDTERQRERMKEKARESKNRGTGIIRVKERARNKQMGEMGMGYMGREKCKICTEKKR